MALGAPARAARMVIGPLAPQPGDILKVTIWPEKGEVLRSVRLAAFDTQNVKFFKREDGSQRAFLGFPYDRHAGHYTLRARVQLTRDGAPDEKVVSGVVAARDRHFPTQRITMKSSTAATMSQRSKLRAEKKLVQSKMQNTSPVPLWSGDWIVPVQGRSTSSYGRKRYVNGKWWGQHSGADIQAGTGTAVRASNSGRVVLSQYLPTLRGNCIVLDHGCNVFTVYMHLSRRLVHEGDRVAKGQHIGNVGATGFVTGPHLHWEMRVGWEPCDPFEIVRSGLNF
jgi:murein DD-endopeptidase MepM/ murein hydrolase activator NlpD